MVVVVIIVVIVVEATNAFMILIPRAVKTYLTNDVVWLIHLNQK